jgi:hypothetical protein
MLEKGIAVVTVGFPATGKFFSVLFNFYFIKTELNFFIFMQCIGLTGGRVRFCLSASHTREMLDKVNRKLVVVDLEYKKKIFSLSKIQKALEAIDVCGDICGIRHSQLNKHRSLKEIREYESYLEQCGANNTDSDKPEKTIY